MDLGAADIAAGHHHTMMPSQGNNNNDDSMDVDGMDVDVNEQQQQYQQYQYQQQQQYNYQQHQQQPVPVEQQPVQQQQQQQQPVEQQQQQQQDPNKMERRGSMTEQEEKERRASIKAILIDSSLGETERRRSIQHLMDGRRSSLGGNSSRRSSGTGASVHSGSGHGDSNGVGGAPPQYIGGADSFGSGGDISSHHSQQAQQLQQAQQQQQQHYQQQQQFTSEEADHSAGLMPINHPPTVPVPNASIVPPPTTTPTVLDVNLCKDQFNNSAEFTAIATEQSKRAELTRPLCSHYERRCTLIAPCCGAAFGCRICHDDCPVLPPKVDPYTKRKYKRVSSLPSSFTSMDTTPEETHHNIDRFAIKEVICRECYTRQTSQTNNCIKCGVQFGQYHCSVCNLWMSDEERPYHCEYCGFCRVGGSENFKHCHDCGMCIDKSLYTNHNCKVGKYKSNCPVCQEYLFSSRSASHEMPCGHAIHWDCFRQLAAHDSRCPVCKKTAETTERMMPTWNAMAAGVAMQPVPPELARVVNITCNDCERNDDARAWHFLGVQCRNCSSFNTVVDRIVLTGEEAHEFLEAIALRNPSREPSRAPRRRYHRRRSNHT